MMSEKIAISECRQGYLLAEDVINNHGVVLVAKDTILNDYIIDKLSNNGIHCLTVCKLGIDDEKDQFDEVFRKDYEDAVLQTKNIFQKLLTGETLDYNHITSITKMVQSYLHSGESIIKCLDKLHMTDEYTYHHSVNVAFYSMLIARMLNLSEEEVELAVQSGLLHDLGKMRIPDDILNKKGRLTKEEFEIIKQHTVFGYELVNQLDGIDNEVKMAVLLHHERFDGSGYPYQCKPEDENFNIYSKIVAIADVFDAMTSDRIYKNKTTPFEVFEMFQTEGYTMFDTKLMKMFIDKLAVYLVGSKVLLSNGEHGEIVYIPLHNVVYPIVQVNSQYIDLSHSTEKKIVSMI